MSPQTDKAGNDAVIAMSERMKEFGFFTPRVKGYTSVERPDLAQKYLWIFRKMIYEFTLDPEQPLTFHLPDGTCLRPDRHFFSDQGSVPRTAQLFVPKDSYPRPFYVHDAACGHGGLYESKDGKEPFVFKKMERIEIDRLLRTMVRAEGSTAAMACTIYTGVRLGWYSWIKWQKRERWCEKQLKREEAAGGQ